VNYYHHIRDEDIYAAYAVVPPRAARWRPTPKARRPMPRSASEAGSGTADWPDGLRGFGRAQGAEKV